MIDFRTKKTRVHLVLSIIYILLLPIILSLMLTPNNFNDFGLIHLLVTALQYPTDFIIFYTQGAANPHTADVFAYIYFAPLVLYWIVFPIIRTAGRWINRGK